MPLKRITEIQWFITGLAVGSLTTLLLTPHSGRQTRRRLVDGSFNRVRSTAEGVLGEERVEQGRRIYQRGEEIRTIVEDTVDIARRARRITRPLEDNDSTESPAPRPLED